MKVYTDLEKSLIIFGIGIGVSSWIIEIGGGLKVIKLGVFLAAVVLLLSITFSVFEIVRFFKSHLRFKWIIVICAIFVLYAVDIFSPFIEIDALSYHLYVPKIFLREGHIFTDKFTPQTFFPLLVENLFTLGLSINNISICKGIILLIGFFLIIGVINFIDVFFDIRISPFPALILLSIPGIWHNSVICYNDIPLTFFEFLSFYFFLKWVVNFHRRDFYLSAVFSGFSINTKYLGLFLLPLLIGSMIIFLIKEKRSSVSGVLKYVSTFLIITLVVGGGIYARNCLQTGNPFFPYLYQIFGPYGWRSDVGSSVGMGKSLIRYLEGFWNLSIFPDKFGGGANQLGVLFLAFLGFIPLGWRYLTYSEKKVIKIILFFCLSYYTLWFIVVQNLRFFYIVGILLCIITGVFIAKVWKKLNKITQILCMVCIGVNFLLSFYYSANKLKGVLAIDKEKYLSSLDRTYRISKWINTHISSHEKILICGEPGIYRFSPYVIRELPFRYLTQYHKENLLWKDMRKMLRGKGFSFVLIRLWYNPQGKLISFYPKDTVPYIILTKKPQDAKCIYSCKFIDKELGTFKYYVFKING